MNPEYVLLALIAALLVVWAWTVHRMTNSAGDVRWSVKTTAPEPSQAELAELKRERDSARETAERLRAELEGRA